MDDAARKRLEAETRYDPAAVEPAMFARWRETGAFFMIRERFELRHGHYTVDELAYKQCKPVDIDVPRGEDIVTYIWVTTPDEHPKNNECEPISIKARTIKF